MSGTDQRDLPTYSDLILPTIRAVGGLGGSAQGREITARLLADIAASEELVAITYPNRPKSVLVDRAEWARSYATLGGALDRPQRGLFVLTALGRSILESPDHEAIERVRDLDREVRERRRKRPASPTSGAADPIVDVNVDVNEGEPEEAHEWREVLLRRLHALSPEGFEEFVIYVLKTFGMELDRVGGTGDEGIDGIGLAPISPVLWSRVAVQAKKHDPASSIGRDVVALFQRDASAAGAERAVLVTLGRFTAAGRKAATAATPTVNLIDGDRLCDLVEQQGVGIRMEPVVVEAWFDRFG